MLDNLTDASVLFDYSLFLLLCAANAGAVLPCLPQKDHAQAALEKLKAAYTPLCLQDNHFAFKASESEPRKAIVAFAARCGGSGEGGAWGQWGGRGARAVRREGRMGSGEGNGVGAVE